MNNSNLQAITGNVARKVTVTTPAAYPDNTELYRELAKKALVRYWKHLETQQRGCQDGHRPSIVSQSSSALFPATHKHEDDESSTPSGNPDYAAPGAICPQDADVLFGRRRSYRLHPGNILLRRLCDDHLVLFDSLVKGGKNELTKVLLDRMLSGGGRFIKYDAKLKCWVNVTTEEARIKIAHRFRDARTSRDVVKNKKIKPAKKESKKAVQQKEANDAPGSRFQHPRHALEALQTLMYR